MPNQLEQKLHQATKAKASLSTNFRRHQCTMISRMKAEYFTRANDIAAIYALLPELMHIKELIWVRHLHMDKQIFLLASQREQSVQLRKTATKAHNIQR